MMKFISERTLVIEFVRALRRTGAPKGFRIALEFDTGNGIADVVLFRRERTEPSTERLLRAISPRLIPLFQFGVLPTPFGADDLQRLSGASNAAVEALAKTLIRVNWARQVAGGRFVLVKHFVSPVPVVVAVEAKLADWRRALEQARRYRAFSHESWVLLDHALVGGALRESERFARQNIGLASLSTDGSLYVHVKARTLPPESDSRYLSAIARLTVNRAPSIKL